MGKSATQHSARARKRANAIARFVAVDGEGSGNLADHKYVLLGVGDTYITSSEQIQWWEAFTALYDHYRTHQGYA